jgi:hypothetical protein
MVDLEKPEAAARIFGCAEDLGLKGHFELDPVDRWEVNQSLQKLDQAIGEKEKVQLWEEGKAMAVEDVIKLAMGEG